jgi:hypothetical protein
MLTENSVRNISSIREMELLKYQYQIRCSHYKLEHTPSEGFIKCAICQKIWHYNKDMSAVNRRTVIYLAEKEDYESME